MSIQSLLTDPNIDSPANIEAADLYGEDEEAYDQRVRDCVESSWFVGGNKAALAAATAEERAADEESAGVTTNASGSKEADTEMTDA